MAAVKSPKKRKEKPRIERMYCWWLRHYSLYVILEGLWMGETDYGASEAFTVESQTRIAAVLAAHTRFVWSKIPPVPTP